MAAETGFFRPSVCSCLLWWCLWGDVGVLARRAVDSGHVWKISWCSHQVWVRGQAGSSPPVPHGGAGSCDHKMSHGVGARALPAGCRVGRTVQTLCNEGPIQVNKLASDSQFLDFRHERTSRVYGGNFRAVHWLRFWTFTVRDPDLISSWGTKSHKSHSMAKRKKKTNKDFWDSNGSMSQKKKKKAWELRFKSSGKCGWLECRPGARREAQGRPVRP